MHTTLFTRRMINRIPPSFHDRLVARADPLDCDNHVNCDVNVGNVGNATISQWDKFSQGEKAGIIVGASAGAMLLISLVACCVWRWLRQRRSN
jgi:hypothetical protein